MTELNLIEPSLRTVLFQKLEMGSGLYYRPLIHHDDHIGIHDGRETVRHHKARAAFSELVQRGLNVLFAFRIQSTGGLVKKQNRSTFQECACDGDTLSLAAGKF